MNGLRVTAQQVKDINALLPAKTRVDATTGVDGFLYLNADLLTDMSKGGTYGKAASILGVLPKASFTPVVKQGTKP